MFRPNNFFGYQCLPRCTRFFVLWSQGCIRFFRVSSETKIFFLLPLLFQNFVLRRLPLGGLRQWPNWPSGRAGPDNRYCLWWLNKRYEVQFLPTPKIDWYLGLMIMNYHQDRRYKLKLFKKKKFKWLYFFLDMIITNWGYGYMRKDIYILLIYIYIYIFLKIRLASDKIQIWCEKYHYIFI